MSVSSDALHMLHCVFGYRLCLLGVENVSIGRISWRCELSRRDIRVLGHPGLWQGKSIMLGISANPKLVINFDFLNSLHNQKAKSHVPQNFRGQCWHLNPALNNIWIIQQPVGQSLGGLWFVYVVCGSIRSSLDICFVLKFQFLWWCAFHVTFCELWV